jgi:predicted ArsR family transcriptional regulator
VIGNQFDELSERDASQTRRRVLAFIADSEAPVDASQIAARIRLHPTTVRFHLGHLEEAGLVRRETVNEQRRGRPRVAYRAAAVTRADGTQRQLIAVLSEALSRQDNGASRAVDAGRMWANELTDDTRSTDGSSPRGVLTGVLDRLGFDPVGDDNDAIRLLACPFREAAARHPEVVCSVHRGLIQRTVEIAGADSAAAVLTPFVKPELCTVTFAS